MVSSTDGSSTRTGEKRRASAPSRSILRNSASVVAPMTRSSPRARSGLSMFAASIAPSAAPAPRTVWSSSMNRTTLPSEATASSSAVFRRCSNCPRNCAPASMPARSTATMRASRRVAGTSPAAIRRARPSAMAVLPTPGSPMRTGLLLRRRARTSTACSISVSRPMTGSMRPSAASAVRSRPKPSSAGVLGVGVGRAGPPVAWAPGVPGTPPKAEPPGPPGPPGPSSSVAHVSQSVPFERRPPVPKRTLIVPGRCRQASQRGEVGWKSAMGRMKI